MDLLDVFNLQASVQVNIVMSEFKSPPAQLPTDSGRKFHVESERLQNVWVTRVSYM